MTPAVDLWDIHPFPVINRSSLNKDRVGLRHRVTTVGMKYAIAEGTRRMGGHQNVNSFVKLVAESVVKWRVKFTIESTHIFYPQSSLPQAQLTRC